MKRLPADIITAYALLGVFLVAALVFVVGLVWAVWCSVSDFRHIPADER